MLLALALALLSIAALACLARSGNPDADRRSNRLPLWARLAMR